MRNACCAFHITINLASWSRMITVFRKALCACSPIRSLVQAVLGISTPELLDQTFAGSRAAPAQKHQKWDVLFARVDHS